MAKIKQVIVASLVSPYSQFKSSYYSDSKQLNHYVEPFHAEEANSWSST